MSTYGDGDPRIPPSAQRAHAEAVRAGWASYVDPATGYAVFTAESLRSLGGCCGNGCRHCPYSAREQLEAGRAQQRPEAG